MSQVPNFRRGAPPEPAKSFAKQQGKSKRLWWMAKYNGTCDYCQGSIQEGIDRVQWNEGGTAVVCASHDVSRQPAPDWTI